MRDLLETLKPAAPARVHVLLAALTWTAVGLGLVSAGSYWIISRNAVLGLLLIPAGLLVGWGKSHLALDRAAGRIVARIESRGDGRCVGGFLSPATWLFVAAMMLAGYLLRHSHLSRLLVGTLYVAVGLALLRSSRVAWRTWYRSRAQPC